MVKRQPLFINLDASLETLKPEEALRIHNYTIDSDGNGALPTATGNGVDEGSNEIALKPIRSNKKVPDAVLPNGYNQTGGCFESITTQEMYYMNKNSEGQDGVYLFDGNTGLWAKVIEDPELGFSDEPEAFMANHRVTLRATYDEQKNIVEKHLIITDGNGWQKWINVVAASKTNGFDATLFPYWSPVAPHFERRHLLEYAVRPPMIKPRCELIPNTAADENVINRIVGKWFVFAYDVEYTDGRRSVLSPWSEPVIVRQEGFLVNPQFIPKKIRVQLDAGNCLVEKINLYVKVSGNDFLLYDTIKKFDNVGPNATSVIGNEYWKRVNPFSDYEFNAEFNTINYIFDNGKLATIVAPEDTLIYQNDLPIKSIACADLGDAVLFSNNLKDYNNFGEDITKAIQVSVREKERVGCDAPLRRVRLYAVIVNQGRTLGGGSWISQFPFYRTDGDTTVRFGGSDMNTAGVFAGIITFTEANEMYNLNFADRKSLRCYLKGTDYYSDGDWFLADENWNLTPFDRVPVIDKDEDINLLQDLYKEDNLFVCVFDFLVPAGVYVATLARHNTPSVEDFRSRSTYMMGIADSSRRQSRTGGDATISVMTPSSITSNDKEMVVDCIAGDVDVLGNGADIFLVFSPEQRFSGTGVRAKYKLLEGYLYESAADDTRIPVEFFSYQITEGQDPVIGNYTDKNGFFWAYSSDGDAREAEVRITGVRDCGASTAFFTSNTPNGNYSKDIEAFLSNTELEPCNRVVVSGRVQDATGTVGYSNVGVSIFGGAEVFTDENGNFEILVHNGYVGAPPTTVGRAIFLGGSSGFVVRSLTCQAVLPDAYVAPPCGTSCDVTRSVVINYSVQISNIAGATSLKENGNYPVAIVAFDYAGRASRANFLSEKLVSSFLQRNNTNATELFWELSSDVTFPEYVAWVGFYVAKNRTYNRYIQWVGDAIEYLDSKGNVTSNTSIAALVRIRIESLLKTNIENNFSMLADYQFVRGDRLRVFGNGRGRLLNTSTFGEPIDVEIYGTNYNDAAVFSGLVELKQGVIAPTSETVGDDPRHIIVPYSKKFDELKGSSGFWIEVYSPSLNNENMLYGEANIYPVVDGKIVRYDGISGNTPQYTNLTAGPITFWDTYHINRSITSAASQSISHIFESPNITDLWGKDVVSTGRVNRVDANVRQQWYRDNTMRSDEFVVDGLINGLGLFRSQNSKDFKGYAWGGIVGTIPQRSAMLFICENDWFLTDFNLNYAQVRDGNFVVVNLGQSLSEPRQKIGDNFGCSYDDTKTIVANDNLVFWHDQKNTAFVMCNYGKAYDITNIEDGGRSTGMKAYYSRKTELKGKHNLAKGTKERMDIVAGIDVSYNNLYVTFRIRRGPTTDEHDFVNKVRGYNFYQQETFVFDIDRSRWVRTVGYTPEAYCALRGNKVGKEFFAFALGQPYRHNDNSVNTFCEFFGIETERFVTLCINEQPEISKVLQVVSLDSNKMAMFSDMLYGTERYCFSRIPMNRFVFRDGYWYAEVLRDECTFATDPSQSMLMDGKAIRGPYFLVRLVGDPKRKTEYQELNALYFKMTPVEQTSKQ